MSDYNPDAGPATKEDLEALLMDADDRYAALRQDYLALAKRTYALAEVIDRLKGVHERRIIRFTKLPDEAYCPECSEDWPCVTAKILAEVQ